MANLLKGALIEYGSDFLGPIPNVVIFQFNPETLSRAINIPPRPSGVTGREKSQAGDIPVEKITLTAHFSADDQLNKNNSVARAFGIGPQLAALEKMVHPQGEIIGAIGAAIDAIGKAIGIDSSFPSQPIPREKYPRILFIWGRTRILPVIIESMNINEQQYDSQLNPIQAEVSLGMEVSTIDRCSKDNVAKGAFEYSELAKESQAILNMANTAQQEVVDLNRVITVRQVVDLIRF